MNYILTYTVYVLIASVFLGLSAWRLFKMMGYKPWMAFVPFYNYYLILKRTGHPRWWAVLSYLPIVGPVMMSVFHLFLMKQFGRISFVQRLLTVILPFIYIAAVNYGKNTVPAETADTPEEEKKETFWGSVVYAVVFATVIHTFVTQPFGIPTGSMERTLLVGDFLFVNKLNYGYRFPMRPVAIPFLQGTIYDAGQKGNPKDDPKSYLESVRLPYFRLPGWEKVKRNDIVVFNYPRDSVHVATDRKDPYVKRAVAVGGDIVEMRGGRLFVNGQPEQRMADAEVQHSYLVYTGAQLDINRIWKIFGYLPVQEGQTDNGFAYQFQGLTDEIAAQIKEMPEVIEMQEVISPKGQQEIRYFDAAQTKIDTTNTIFPLNKPWNQDWYGPIRVPRKGEVIKLTADNLPEYQWLIANYERNKLENRNGKIFINDRETNEYKIQQDYYFMMGDNRDASLDGRFFGFVPEENIVGKPMFTWLSIQGAFDEGPKKIRWNRMFKATNTGDKDKTSYWWIAAAVLILFFGWEYFMKLFGKKKKDD
ncbi:MAG: signal peptidase I [Chryseobacterium sp.]|nr:MAG: signal peptidase I [Chryseobacterium sp.]